MRMYLVAIVGLLVSTACTAAEDAPGGTSSPDNSGPSSLDQQEFTTDFSRSSISFDEVMAGGPAKDGIPAIDDPRFSSQQAATEWLDQREPVLIAQWPENDPEAEARIYPLQILTWHEIVNDRIAGDPVIVTYCPLCNTGVGFVGQLDGRELEFGVSGRLRYSNMLMYDRQTESWWQQATGEAVVGELTGRSLRLVPLLIMSFRDARREFPEAVVLNRETGFSRPYGSNPYQNYDQGDTPFLYEGPEIADDAPMLERVVALEHGGQTEAVTYSRLQTEGAVQLEIAGDPLVVLWSGGTSSALEHRTIAQGRDVGSANVFLSQTESAEGERTTLSFEPHGASGERGQFTDQQTGSVWSAAGRAIEGPLQGRRLTPLPSIQHFWFSYQAFAEEWGQGSNREE